jgi:hypothetical protein
MTTMDALLSGIGMGDQYCAASFPPDFFCYARDDISSELRIEHYSSEMQGVSKKESGPSCRISPTESISINGQYCLLLDQAYRAVWSKISFSFSLSGLLHHKKDFC